ncbi:3-demethylubiquinone-9 3-O-methyltransferase [Cladophialophora immunda]|uniref:Ubiquinone biosynthesis O-methyltransferase, mitochondrial n=1 Tax=Cladophialophora immunda TaxID=569365 RepID=A0A0D2BX50_9EURO|nr:3-demethylubiquinone-9 3-O-methyltransferase [Cladophialophora immunda]KIW22915.1 3-demethylubiquinone-9 3-O-methyltransferase [Cladophialophora immunda]
MAATVLGPLRHAAKGAGTCSIDALRTPPMTRSCLRALALERARTQRTTSQGRRYHSSLTTDASTASSVSASEVTHFSRLASSWWDPHGPSRLLHLMNPLRHDFIRSCLQRPSPDTCLSEPDIEDANEKRRSYLDVGCGGGIFASSAARLPTTSRVTAIDPTESVIQVAKEHQRSDPALAAPGKLEYRNCAIEDLPDGATYDVLTVFEVLEHIDSPSSFLETAIPHLKPGGWLIGSTISRSPVAYLTTKLIAEAPLIGVVPRGTHDWNKYINPPELRGYFESGRAPGRWGEFVTQGVVYVPALGWRFVQGSEEFGNYFFGVQKLE